MTLTNGWYSSESQIAWCCRNLLQGRSLNHRMEFREVRGWRLTAICHRLKSQYGWPILCELRGPENVAHYCLRPDFDRTALRFPPSARALAEEGEP